MTLFYGLVLLAGLIAGGGWLVMTAIANSVDGWEWIDPESRWGSTGRYLVAGCIGFGMAGISVLYTAAPEVLSIVGGIAGAAALILVARVFGPSPQT